MIYHPARSAGYLRTYDGSDEDENVDPTCEVDVKKSATERPSANELICRDQRWTLRLLQTQSHETKAMIVIVKNADGHLRDFAQLGRCMPMLSLIIHHRSENARCVPIFNTNRDLPGK